MEEDEKVRGRPIFGHVPEWENGVETARFSCLRYRKRQHIRVARGGTGGKLGFSASMKSNFIQFGGQMKF